MLEKINDNKDLKKLTIPQLNKLACEVRNELIKIVSNNGGHLAPNLGAVEFTIALHKIFDSPKDKIIFDVGHQCYTHKLLTGRKNKLHTIRQENGLSGFPKIKESKHDAFGVGHSSTSISAALGIAKGANLIREKHHTICVIGDGAMTGGLALEGLNQAGYLDTNLIIVLNDNEMSISNNVGAMANYTSRIKHTKVYKTVKNEVEKLINSNICSNSGQIIKEELQYLTNPGIVFQKLGIDYLGPIDGHDISQLIDIFSKAKKYNKPVLVHIKTVKGRGYCHAEKDAETYHGVSSFNIIDGKKKSKSKTSFTSIFGKKMVELGYIHSNLLAITAAMPSGTGLKEFAKHFPDRFFDVGIAEQHAVTFAAGLATKGLKPVVAIYSTFLQRAYDQLIHDVALQKLPVIFALDRGGLVGEDGPTHHGVFDISYLRHIPNFTVMVPKDEHELQSMMDFAVKHDGPIAFRYPRDNITNTEPKYEELVPIKMGKSETIKDFSENNKRKIAIISIGKIFEEVKLAIDEINNETIDFKIINARFVKPIDEEMIKELSTSADYIITVEENSLMGGFGSAVLEYIENLKEDVYVRTKKVKRIGLPDKFIEHASPSSLRKKYDLDKEGIIKCIKDLI